LSTLKQSFNRKISNLKPSLKYSVKKRSKKSRTPILKQSPQVKGIVTKVVTMSPKKPNSAIRHVAKVDLTSGLRVTARLPGKGYLCGKFSRVLVEGGRANDLPGVGYSVVRGVYDFSPVVGKIKRRSVYGVSRPSGYSKHIRRSIRG
jgi:small subunit ribosomal protein S12